MSEAWTGGMDGVKVAGTIGAKNLAPGMKVLHRETKGVKFDRTSVVTSEFTNKE